MGEAAKDQEIKILDMDKTWYLKNLKVSDPLCEISNQGLTKLLLVTILVMGMFCIRTAELLN